MFGLSHAQVNTFESKECRVLFYSCRRDTGLIEAA